MAVFRVHFEERVTRETHIEVVAPDESFLDDKEVQRELLEAATEQEWDEDSWGVELGRVGELDKEEDGACVFISVDGNYFSDEEEYLEHEEALQEDLARRPPPPLPGQLGIVGIGKDVPK